MSRRMHPLIVDRICRRPHGDVLLNHAVACARLRRPRAQVRLAIVLVRDRPFRCHAQAVLQGCVRQRRIPIQPTHSRLRAHLVGQRENPSGLRMHVA